MKRNLSILFLVFMLPFGRCLAQKALFERYENVDGVTIVYISQGMLRLMPNIGAAGKDMSSISNKLDAIRILSCERKSLIPTIRKQAEEILKKEKYEILININESSTHATIYQRRLKKGRSEAVILNSDTRELSVINIQGTFTLDEIKNLSGSN